MLGPVRGRYAELTAAPEAVRATLRRGAATAETVASATLERAREAIGLLSRG